MIARVWQDLCEVGRAWSRYECASLSASVAFFAAVSLFPFLITLIAGLGAFLELFQSGQDARAEVLRTFSEQYSPEMAEAVDRLLSSVQLGATANGPVAAAAFALTATLVFVQVDRGFERIWDMKHRRLPGAWRVARGFLFRRLRALALLMLWGGLVLVVFGIGFLLRTLREVGREFWDGLSWSAGIESLLIGFTINTLAFAFLYKMLSKGRVGIYLPLRSALLAALLWEAGSKIVASLVIGDRYSAYGVIGSFVAVLLWIYFNTMVLFLGALFVRVRARPLREGQKTTR